MKLVNPAWRKIIALILLWIAMITAVVILGVIGVVSEDIGVTIVTAFMAAIMVAGTMVLTIKH